MQKEGTVKKQNIKSLLANFIGYAFVFSFAMPIIPFSIYCVAKTIQR